LVLSSNEKYPVSKIEFAYGKELEGLPSLSELGNATVALGDPENEILLDELLQGIPDPLDLSYKDLYKLCEVPLHFLKAVNFEGIVAYPDANDIDPVSGEDLRSEGDKTLTIRVWISQLGNVSMQFEQPEKRENLRISKSVKSYIQAGEFEGKPIRKDLLNALKRMSSHSSRTSKVVLAANEETKMVDAVIKVEEKSNRPNFFLSASNSGSDSTGEWLFSAAYFNDQLTGLDDTLTLSYICSNTWERHGLNIGYFIPFFPQKTFSVGLNTGYSTYDSSTFAVSQINFDGDMFSLDTSLMFDPVALRGDDASLGFEIGLNFENVSAFNSILGSASFNTLTPRVGMKLDTQGKYRMSRSSLFLKGNVLSISDSEQLTMGGIDTQDTYARLAIKHLENVKFAKIFSPDSKSLYLDRHLLSLRFEASWALSSGRHLPSHQFITGGSHSIRGYPESIVAGDTGYLFSLEYRIPFFLLDDSDNVLAWSILPFFDFGMTQVNNSLFYESDHSLFGMGLGFEFELPLGAYARVDFAKPIKELSSMGVPIDGTRSKDYRIHGNLRWKF